MHVLGARKSWQVAEGIGFKIILRLAASVVTRDCGAPQPTLDGMKTGGRRGGLGDSAFLYLPVSSHYDGVSSSPKSPASCRAFRFSGSIVTKQR
jgi:hypothetical protein